MLTDVSHPVVHKRGFECKESDLTSSVMERTGSPVPGGDTEMESIKNLRGRPSYKTSMIWEDVINFSPTESGSIEMH